jgi:hypothetical protein
MFTYSWCVRLYDSSRRDDTFAALTKDICAPNCLLFGIPKGIRTLNFVYHMLQLHQGKRITVLVVAII